VQDLEFPAACHRLKATPDGQYLFATGIHAPRLRVYELSQLSMKFERHFDAEIVDFQVLIFVTCSVYNFACGLAHAHKTTSCICLQCFMVLHLLTDLIRM